MSFSLKAFLGLKKRRVAKTAPTKAVPNKSRPAQQPAAEVVRLTHGKAKEYWASRIKGNENDPNRYVQVDLTRTKFLEERIREHLPKTARILEIGPNAGRNLAYLHDMGFKNLAGIEINPAAVEVMRKSYPQLADVPITVSPIEDAIKAIEDGSIDLIFTMAVLEHVHFDSNWIFAEMARIAPNIITIEDETSVSERHFPRQYKTVFEELGMGEADFAETVPGLTKKFRYRFFKRGIFPRLRVHSSFNGYTVVSTFPKDGTKNIGDLLIEQSTKRLIEDIKGNAEFHTVFRADDLDDHLSEMNASKSVVLACLAIRRDMVPKIYNFRNSLQKIRVPMVPLASGTRLAPKELLLDQMGSRTEYDQATIEFIKAVSEKAEAFSCRGEVSYNFVRSHGVNNAVMTGDVAFYDPRFDGLQFQAKRGLSRIAISSPGEGKLYADQFYALAEAIRKRLPTAEATVFVHGASEWLDTERLQSLRMDVSEIYKQDLSALDEYANYDVHIGFRVHAHVSALKRRIPSYLLAPDGRGYDYGKTLRTGTVWNAWRVEQEGSGLSIKVDMDIIDYALDVIERDEASGFDRFLGFEREIAKFNERLIEFVRRMP